jgi:hypothetical protein
MFVSDEELPGLNIIRTKNYIDLITVNPGFPHESFGDFYTEMPQNMFAKSIYLALEKEVLGIPMNVDMIFVNEKDFNEEAAVEDIDYLIESNEGVRLYSPVVHNTQGLRSNMSVVYGFAVLAFAKGFFSDKKEGTFQKNLRKLEREIEEFQSKFIK